MESLKELCKCCKFEQCLKNQIVIKEEKDCVTIKCLQFIKDEKKIVKPEEFIYIIKSDYDRQ